MVDPLPQSVGGFFTPCDVRAEGKLIPGGMIITDRGEAERLWAAGVPLVPYNEDGGGDEEIDALLVGYFAQKRLDPSQQFAPYLTPLIKQAFDDLFRILQTRVGFFNGVGPWNPQVQFGPNFVSENPGDNAVLNLPVIDPTKIGDVIGGRVTLMRQGQQAASVTLHSDVEQIGIGWPNNPLAVDYDMSAIASLDLVLSIAPIGPGPVPYWHITSIVLF